MSNDSTLGRVLRAVRRRALIQLMLEQGSYALAIALAALIALLLIGTQLLDWYWPPMLLVGAFAVGLYRVRGRVPTAYEVAQQIDRRLGLRDTISTAVYFGENETPAAKSLIEAQRGVAESMARSADPVAASPLFVPKQAYACLALLVVSASLLVVRYGFRGSLDLEQPLFRIPFDTLSATPEVVAKAKASPKQKLPADFEGVSVPNDGTEEAEGEKKKTPEEIEIPGETVDTDETDGREAQMTKDGKSSEKGGKDGAEAGEKGDGDQAGDDKAQQDAGSNAKGPQNAKSPGQTKNPNSSNQQADNSSLMEKMKDAMANLMSRMKMNPKSGEQSKKSSASDQGAAQSASAQQKMGQKGSQAPGKKGDGQSKSDEAGDQEGEGAAKSMNAQGKMSDAGGEKQMAQEGKSGAGKQDGEKDIKQAEQAAAMGKISELLGKRAQNMTGEIMVEVSSGRQQLKTQYTQKNAAHTEAGGDISRDEVPAAYQQFVQSYFDEVRKTPSAPKTPAK
ncbi:MAG: hypothetical protein JNK48_09700 [Bryobacterales bacterium]|nr:hypothetical protein [Bryobacterales bacterium]